MKWYNYIVYGIGLLLFASKSYALSVNLPDLKLQFTTKKVVTIKGDIDEDNRAKFAKDMAATKAIPGPRVIIIDSDGGDELAGRQMIDIIKAEKKHGVKVICIGDGEVVSMGFNIMTNCDVRLSTDTSKFMAHPIRTYMYSPMFRPSILRPRDLKTMYLRLSAIEAPYRAANSKAMHLSLKQYDKYAYADKWWTPKQLNKMGYLQGIVVLKYAPTNK